MFTLIPRLELNNKKMFFSVYTQWKIPGGNFQTAKPLPIKSTAVIGAGTMGTGIAVCLLNAGYQVYLLEQNQKVLYII